MAGLFNIFSKKKIDFAPIKFTECETEVCNPERGWYKIFPFVIGDEINLTEAGYSLSDKEYLVLVRIDIGNYADIELPAEALARIREIIEFFRDNGKDIILRVTYDSEGNAMVREPSVFAMVEKHMEQVAGLIKDYAGSIFVYQGLLIGNWGEMHSSRYATDKYLQRLMRLLGKGSEGSDSRGNTFFGAVRTPAKHKAVNSYSDIKIGIYDDAVLASENDLGTYQNVADEQAYESTKGLMAPNGGEAVYGEGYADRLRNEQIIDFFEKKRITYLNTQYDRRLLDKLDKRGLLDIIGRRLGYRYIVKKAAFVKGGSIFEITIRNAGFAPIYRETKSELIIAADDGREYDIPLELNLAQRAPEDGDIIVGVNARLFPENVKGKLYLRTVRGMDNRQIYFANTATKDGNTLLGEIR